MQVFDVDEEIQFNLCNLPNERNRMQNWWVRHSQSQSDIKIDKNHFIPPNDGTYQGGYSGYQSQGDNDFTYSRFRENDRIKEDFHSKVKPFNSRETNWFTSKTHFEALSFQVAWSPSKKCVRLMRALPRNFDWNYGWSKQPVIYDQLSNR